MFAIEYSAAQDAYHVEELDRVVDKNFCSYAFSRLRSDYQIIHLAETRAEAGEVCSLLQKRRAAIKKEVA